ncbi:hypothetical protein STEG23_014641 [Scotinomys teguina]
MHTPDMTFLTLKSTLKYSTDSFPKGFCEIYMLRDEFLLCSPSYLGTLFGAQDGLELTVNAGIAEEDPKLSATPQPVIKTGGTALHSPQQDNCL